MDTETQTSPNFDLAIKNEGGCFWLSITFQGWGINYSLDALDEFIGKLITWRDYLASLIEKQRD